MVDDEEAGGAAAAASARPTVAERREAAEYIAALVAMGPLAGKARRVSEEAIALALAWRRSDASLAGLSAKAAKSLFGLSELANVERDWLKDDRRARLDRAEEYLALDAAGRAAFVYMPRSEALAEARRAQREQDGACRHARTGCMPMRGWHA